MMVMMMVVMMVVIMMIMRKARIDIDKVMRSHKYHVSQRSETLGEHCKNNKRKQVKQVLLSCSEVLYVQLSYVVTAQLH